MADLSPRVPPPWARDLVIYELNPRTYTSPAGDGDGSGSGTFASLLERLDYLADLGINAVWLAGFHEATDHFYGIWSVYAAVRHDIIDPKLGTEDDLRRLIQAAHERGIRIFLDVISHGVIHSSPLVTEHPDWFNGDSWGMADFDYTNAEFRRWWVQTWANYALDFGVDGYRVDVSLVDPTIWDEIVVEVRSQGSDIAVFPENGRYHFSQRDFFPTDNPVLTAEHRAFVEDGAVLSSIQLSSHDNGWLALPGNHFSVRGSRARIAHGGLLLPHIPVFYSGEELDLAPTHVSGLRQGLFGEGGPGGWMYGNRFDWSQLDSPRHREMYEDVRTILSIRKRFAHLLNADPSARRFAFVAHDGATRLVPFAAFVPGELLVVVANDLPHDVASRLTLPLELAGIDPATATVTDVVSGLSIAHRHGEVEVVVPADGQKDGGYRVLHATGSLVAPKLEPTPEEIPA